eukprot:TRINITY_DN15076_c0_g1_i1.p1 TRINITY_DN15076_c0_g1~~TRINITY_DN15076_c0_g1_i1.p1  ORF type:complete len:171 (+),score=45.97 TRINITY_DN15076_c0_g1_i1:248-760(+)
MSRANFIKLIAAQKLQRTISKSDSPSDKIEHNDKEFLCMGDKISLYSIDGNGYLTSEGFTDTNCYVEKSSKRRLPKNFNDCVYTIVPRYKYDAHNALNESLERWSRDRESIGKGLDPEEQELTSLKSAEDAEQNENLQEFERTAGTNITYGQMIQVKIHLNIEQNYKELK